MTQEDVNTTKKIISLQFGELLVEPHHIFYFQNGLLGFEELREFVLISEEETLPFKWLICVEKPEIGFPLLSPWHIDLTYDPGNDFDQDRQVVFVVVTLEDDQGRMTANMKAPVILEIDNQTGEQVILPKDKYLPDLEIPVKKQ